MSAGGGNANDRRLTAKLSSQNTGLPVGAIENDRTRRSDSDEDRALLVRVHYVSIVLDYLALSVAIVILVVLPDPPDDVAVHDLHVINVEQQLHPRRVHAADQVDAQIDIVAEVAWVAFHRM